MVRTWKPPIVTFFEYLYNESVLYQKYGLKEKNKREKGEGLDNFFAHLGFFLAYPHTSASPPDITQISYLCLKV